MKRSGQVLLVVMGVTTTTAVGHYLAPPRTECAQQTAAANPGTPQEVTQQPCRTTGSRSSGGHSWWRSSGSDNRGASSSESGRVAASAQTSAPGATRGGFGSTGHGISSGS